MSIIVHYDADEHCFKVLINNNEIISIDYFLRDKDDKGNSFYNEEYGNYEYQIFFKKNFAENDIFVVHEKQLKKRIGWLFPISSIISLSHDFSNDPHYCRYAFIAHYLLIRNDIKVKEYKNQNFATIINENYTNKGAIIFIYEKALVKDIPGFKTSDYYCSFYQYGYYLKEADPNPAAPPLPRNNKIRISKIASSFSSDNFLNDFFNHLFFEEYPIIRFHILYQIIELIIENILISSLEGLIKELKEKKIYSRNLREKISRIEKESDRISLLQERCKTDFDHTLLDEKCNNFLASKGRQCAEFPKSLYALRNFVVHDFRHMFNDIEIVKDINYQFELWILDFLTTYSHEK